MEAFKDWRLTDARNDGRVAPASFDTDRAALNSFYGWASSRYGITNPVPTAPRRGWRRAGDRGPALGDLPGRDGLRPASATRRQVKWMLRPGFEQWVDIGLRGYGFDGLRRAGWRGGSCEDRDIAFADGLCGTGLRLTEWASILDVELPSAGGVRYARAYLAAACAKGGRHGREYRIPRSVLSVVEAYLDPVEGSRPLAISRAQRVGRYDELPGARIVTGYDARTRVLHLAPQAGGSRARTVPVDVLGPGERRLLFRETEHGLEPLAVWLTPAGMPKKPQGWEDTFQAANARIQQAWAANGQAWGGAVVLPTAHVPAFVRAEVVLDLVTGVGAAAGRVHRERGRGYAGLVRRSVVPAGHVDGARRPIHHAGDVPGAVQLTAAGLPDVVAG